MKTLFLSFSILFAAGCAYAPSSNYEHRVHETPERGKNIIYCVQCGVTAGKSTKCPKFQKHSFVSIRETGKIICLNCGGIPMETPYECRGFVSHSFQHIDD
ncbi:MAG: hypothetical protein ACO1QB_15790 [Verrucomicrobiales bacterium]